MNDSGGWMYATMIIAGLAIPAMAAMNADLGQKVGAPTAAATLFAAALLSTIAFATLNGGLRFGAFPGVPWRALIGGAIVAFYVLSITILGPGIGVGTAIILVLLGQIVSSAVIDHFGLLGAARTPISGTRLLGIVFIMVGVALARRPIALT